MAFVLFNPFRYIAGGKALAIGWATMLVTAVIASRGNTHFDGIIDAHSGLATPFIWYIADAAVAWGLTVIFFYVAALLYSGAAVRLIDIAGTMAMARQPMLLIALLFLALPPLANLQTIKTIHDIGTSTLLISLGATVCSIWMIALMYHAFRVSSNLKGIRLNAVFVVTLLAAEILSKILFYLLYRHVS